jgi:uncharacterized protein YndB with AHSA1/START domain
MTTKTRLHFDIFIQAPPERVWRTMLDHGTYEQWTTPFHEGSTYEGSWDAGSRIRFVSPPGDGMVATIAENRRHEFLSIKHLGMLTGGIEDLDSPAVRAWAPAFENYTFTPRDGGTEVGVDIDVTDDWAQMMRDMWPKALEKLKKLCERPA